MNKANARVQKWTPADSPPDADPGKWSRNVVVITNFGNVFLISYFPGENNPGVWQRPSGFIPGESVEFWIDQPELS